jgi:hypothetical protein
LSIGHASGVAGEFESLKANPLPEDWDGSWHIEK